MFEKDKINIKKVAAATKPLNQRSKQYTHHKKSGFK
jgi:hypothetical protein